MGPRRREALHHERRGGRHLHRGARSPSRNADATARSARSSSRRGRPASPSGGSRRRWGSTPRHTGELLFDGCRIPADEPAGRARARATALPEDPRRRADRDRGHGPGPGPGGLRGRIGLRQGARAVRAAHRLASRASPSRWPTWRPRSTRRGSSCTARRGSRTRASRTRPRRPWPSSSPARSRARVTNDAIQVHGGYGYVARVPGRALPARREADRDRGGDERDPATRDRPQPARHPGDVDGPGTDVRDRFTRGGLATIPRVPGAEPAAPVPDRCRLRRPRGAPGARGGRSGLVLGGGGGRSRDPVRPASRMPCSTSRAGPSGPAGGWAPASTTWPRRSTGRRRSGPTRWRSSGRARTARCAASRARSCAGEVDRAARAMAALGVGRYDRVGIFMPMIPETVIAVLAVGKLGAVYTPIFSGYGAPAVASRLADCEAKLLVTADGFCAARQGRCDMKSIADAALAAAPTGRALPGRAPHRDAAEDVPWTEGRDVGGTRRVDIGRRTSRCHRSATDANDPYMVIYTSGHDRQAQGRGPRPRRLPAEERGGPRPLLRPAARRRAVLVHRHGLDDGSVGGGRRRSCSAPRSSSTRARPTIRGRIACGTWWSATGSPTWGSAPPRSAR